MKFSQFPSIGLSCADVIHLGAFVGHLFQELLFMRLFAPLSGLFSLAGLALNQLGMGGLPLYVGITGLIVAVTLSASKGLGPFFRFFTTFYGFCFVLLIALLLAQPYLPPFMMPLVLPPLTAFTAGAFVIVGYLLARVPVIREVAAIADPYFETQDKRPVKLWPFGTFTVNESYFAMFVLAIIILINLGQVAISVRINEWGREWFDAIQNKNGPEFWRLLYSVWVPWVGVLIFSNFVEYILMSVFKIRWRNWMTERLVARWLDDGTHYRISLTGNSVDNPDQRIQEDINKYIATTYSLSITLIQQISSLISFSVILWGMSGNLTLPGSDMKIPGLLFWCALIYATIGTFVTHLIGRKLIPLYFRQEQYEASFRFGLARLREFSEPVTLLHGETAEKKRLSTQFGDVINNFYRIVGINKWLSAFTQLYGSSNSVVPYIIVAPFYFVGTVTLGVMNQAASAFSRVDSALSFFIDRYATLADYKAVVNRLTSFEASIRKALLLRDSSLIVTDESAKPELTVHSLDLDLPDGRHIVSVDGLTLGAGTHTLFSGPSGSGKSTLFRAIVGIWPFGKGRIDLPHGASLMVLPQRPYIPLGNLRAAICYPHAEGIFPDETIRLALEAVKLPQLVNKLDEDVHWTQVLSGGEQQRLALARAILSRPKWLLLDESTSALDEALEAEVYQILRAAMPETSVISIGHRSSLAAFHDARIAMVRGEDGIFRVQAAAL